MSDKLAAYHDAAALPELPDEPTKGNGTLPAWHWHVTPLATLSQRDLEQVVELWRESLVLPTLAADPFEQMLLSEIENRRGCPPK